MNSKEEKKRKKLEERRRRKYEAAILQYTGVATKKTPSQPAVHLKKKKKKCRLEMLPTTEQGIIEVLGGPAQNSALWPETDDRLVQLTVLKLDDDLSIPVLDLDK